LATCPRRGQKLGAGERGVAVQLPGALVRPGEWIYADIDGVLVASAALN
jgi:regulator of ribonuclease activity A